MTAVHSIDVRTGEVVSAVAAETDAATVDRICVAAQDAAPALEDLGRSGRAALLRDMADEVEADRDGIVTVADRETGLGRPRLTGELTRTAFQLRLFADVLAEASYLEATIDRAAETAMGPRPDLRRMLVPLGPVGVFGASNFPLAFSVPGGDTASALAAGCPVVIKAHSAHPATAVRCFEVLAATVAARGLPDGTVGLVHGRAAGTRLVQHPAITAVGFTGSLAGGRALHDVAAARPRPIPFYGELGSLNPLIVTPGAAAADPVGIAQGFAASFTLGTGQFCTKPGLLFLPAGAAGDNVRDALAAAVAATTAGPMLSAGISDAYRTGAQRWRDDPRAALVAEGSAPDGTGFTGTPLVLTVAATDLTGALAEECFGPAALIVRYAQTDDLVAALGRLDGQLTATLHAHEEPELVTRLTRLLRGLAGRILFGGYPTGVAVCWAQQHGGPYPATTAAGHTSVGATSIRRWLRPVTFQQAPVGVLPPELRDDNPDRVPQRVDGELRLPG